MEHTYTLTVTDNCNLACFYCYEHNRNGRIMSFDTARTVLDNAFRVVSFDDLLTIDFFGGEPFLAFDLIKEIVEYTRQASKERRLKSKFRFFATTNGTLIHGAIQDWLRETPSFTLGLSLDGTKEMHDTNRCNSFHCIDLPFFLELYPKQPIKMTISSQTLSTLAEGVIFCHKKGFSVSCNLAYGIDWNNDEYLDLLEAQIDILIDYYLRHPNTPPCSLLSRKLAVVSSGKPKQTVQRWCGSGTAMHTFDCDGKQYPCQYFMPISCGQKKAERAWQIQFHERVPVSVLDEKCRSCIAIEVCPTCYGSNYVESGNIYQKNDAHCALEKVIIYENACFFVKRWDAGLLTEMPENELIASLSGAKQIIEKFAR